jgi:hypothetical protein
LERPIFVRYYSFSTNFTDEASKKLVTMDFFMIDTVIAEVEDGIYGDALLEEFPHAQYPPNAPSSAQQWAWLEAG